MLRQLISRLRELRERLGRRRRPWHRQITSTLDWDANVHVHVHNVDTLRGRYPEWDSLSRRAKLARTRDVQPAQADNVANVTCVGLHEAVADGLNPDKTAGFAASHLILGDDGSQTSTGDTALNNRVGAIEVTDSIDNGATLKSSIFIDSSQLNGETLAEVGLATASSGGTLLNHAAIDEIVKTADNTLTIDVDLRTQDM